MRFAYVLPAVLLATGCVPDVAFLADGGTHDAARDAPAADGQMEAAADAEGDAGDAADAPYDGPAWCTGAEGGPPGFKCCMGVSGVVCGSNMCTSTACVQCATINCSWPNVCCATMGVATCKPAGGC